MYVGYAKIGKFSKYSFLSVLSAFLALGWVITEADIFERVSGVFCAK
jgi:hypothetical protein